MLKKILLNKLKELDDISFCYNCGAVISDQNDYNDREDIAICSQCGTENRKYIELH